MCKDFHAFSGRIVWQPLWRNPPESGHQNTVLILRLSQFCLKLVDLAFEAGSWSRCILGLTPCVQNIAMRQWSGMNHRLPDKSGQRCGRGMSLALIEVLANLKNWKLYQIARKAIGKVIKEREPESVLRNVKDGLPLESRTHDLFWENRENRKTLEKMESFLKILPSFKGCKRCRK